MRLFWIGYRVLIKAPVKVYGDETCVLNNATGLVYKCVDKTISSGFKTSLMLLFVSMCTCIIICDTLSFKNLWSVKFYSNISSAQQGCIDQNTVKTVIVWNIKITVSILIFLNVIKCNLFLWCKAEFSASLLQSSVSHDPSEIILICKYVSQETFIISHVKTVELLNIFCGNLFFLTLKEQFI